MRNPFRSTLFRTVLIVICAMPVAVVGWRTIMYPYGWSHCCDKIIVLQLHDYARSNHGKFPAGEESPEASLSLFYKNNEDLSEVLRGKSVDVDVVRSRLQNGKLLTPDTCGWVCVEGLWADDDSRLAVLWDKAGLDHNGRRLLTGGHVVTFLNAQEKHIAAKDWADFEKEQRQLREMMLAKRALFGNANNPPNNVK